MLAGYRYVNPLIFSGTVICLSISMGALAALLPQTLSAACIGLLLGVLVLAFVRGLLVRRDTPASVLRTTSAQLLEAPDYRPAREIDATDADFRLARWLFYGGMLTIAQLTLRPPGGLNLSDWLFFCGIGVVLLQSLALRSVRGLLLPGGLVVGMLLFAVGGIASSYRAELPLSSAFIVARVLYLTIGWFWLAIAVLRKPEQIRIAMACWVLSAALTGGSALAQLMFGDVIPGTTPTWGRMTGFTPHPNELGAATAVALIPALVLALNSNRTVSIMALACVVLIASGEFLSGSVSALAAVAVGGMVWFACAQLSRGLLFLFGALALCVVAIFIILNETDAVRSPLKRLDEVTAKSQKNATLWSRVSVYEAGIGSVARDPWIGIGLDMASQERVSEDELQVHNIILGPWVTSGVLGLAGILITLTSVLVIGRNVVVQATSREDYQQSLALFAATLTFVVYAMTAPALYTRYGWVPVALLLAYRAYQLGLDGTISLSLSIRRLRLL